MFPNIGGDFAHRVQLMEAGEDQFFNLPASSGDFFFINLKMNKPLDDLQTAVLCQDFFPEIGAVL